MDSENEQEEYYGKCGELFLTIKGNIAFHCTLCENIYKNFEEYNGHILEVHYAPVFNEEQTVFMTDEDSSFSPLTEADCQIDDVEYIVKENDDTEVYTVKGEIDVPDQLEILNNELDMENQRLEIETLSNDSSELNLPASQPVELNPVESSHASSNNEAIRTHLRTVNVKPTITNRKYECPHCGFSGASRTNMKQHIQRHSLNKRHQCTECLKAFHTRTELKIHIRIHTGERPYLCTLCGQAFTSSGKLNSHQKRHYNIRDKECPICKMRFFGTNPLRSHMAVHSEKRNYKCEQCDACFKLSSGLKAHMKLHENKRNYQCKLCDSRFNQNAGLYSHMKTCHSNEFYASKGYKL